MMTLEPSSRSDDLINCHKAINYPVLSKNTATPGSSMAWVKSVDNTLKPSTILDPLHEEQSKEFRQKSKDDYQQPQKNKKKIDYKKPPETTSYADLARMRQELAKIQSENMQRDDLLQGLRNEVNQMLLDLNNARSLEKLAILEAQATQEEENSLRNYLNKSLDKIPKLRKKVEKCCRKAGKLQLKIDIITSVKNGDLCNAEKLKKRGKAYKGSRGKRPDYEKEEDEDRELTRTPRQQRRRTNITDWTGSANCKLDCSASQESEMAPAPATTNRTTWKDDAPPQNVTQTVEYAQCDCEKHRR